MHIRVVTAAALFDGHDVSINIFRRLLQKKRAEVIHLGHNRSVKEVITVALQEDADAILVSSYQGGHNEYFKFIIDSLKVNNALHIKVFGGGGGVILPSEISDLEKYGVERIYHAIDGQKIGIDGIADDIVSRIKTFKSNNLSNFSIHEDIISNNNFDKHYDIAKQLSLIENIEDDNKLSEIRDIYKKHNKSKSLVLGITGTGGSGKSSLIDEIIGRFVSVTNNISVGILAIDPTKSQTGGALLGDRIRYNQIYNDRVYLRSFATRSSKAEINDRIEDAICVLKSCGFDLIIVETSGIGQGDSRVVEISDKSIYVMTAEFGAPSQLEKIDMLDKADFVVINKFEKRGSEDAYREVLINYIRNNSLITDKTTHLDDLELPVYAVCSNQFNNAGVNRLFKDIYSLMKEKFNNDYVVNQTIMNMLPTKLDRDFGLIDNDRVHYLSEIAETVRNYKKNVYIESELADKYQALEISNTLIDDESTKSNIYSKLIEFKNQLSPESLKFIENWQSIKKEYTQDEINYQIQNKQLSIKLFSKSLSGTPIPKVALPEFTSYKELLKYYYLENLPGNFPYTAGVFPFKRTTEDPKRQFAGEGSPERTNKRFHYLSHNDDAKRLSVAFDGITLYAEDPAEQPDIFGKIGEAGVSVCCIDDMDKLLDGFDLLHPLTSVSMTINAPAPIMVAFYFMTAVKRVTEKQNLSNLSYEEKENLKIQIFRKLRGTVQADMLKEDQGQNTIIFSIDFAMRLIGDLQEYLSKNKIQNYYSLSISGYHIAEAGANPITQLAFTLANGFTYVEYFLNRGISIDDFAPNLSFFFSNGMDPEYSVIGRVARRIWAIAMRNKYGANDKSQKLKYHIQTSGRSLHAQEIDFNDIRTTLQGLLAFYDNCNSLHTNSYDEAITTPTEESVRRAMAIQLILSKEFGMLKNENPTQGAYITEQLTELVEEAVLMEFSRISRRGGVLGAMETQYQRSKIQEESMYYEYLKQTGEYPIIGVNTFQSSDSDNLYDNMQVIRTSIEEKQSRLDEINQFKHKNNSQIETALHKLKEVALSKGNIFEELLNTVEVATMGQITKVLYEIGGKYRRGM